MPSEGAGSATAGGLWRLTSKDGATHAEEPNFTMLLPVPGKPSLTVGRKAPADIVLDKDKAISRTHAAFSMEGASLAVKDEGSKFGTYVNDARLEKEPCNLGERGNNHNI